MARPFHDSPAKQTVREHWDTPILRHLHKEYGFRFRYFGLPGVDATDVFLWKDMIDEVVAFELPSGGADERAHIRALRTSLRRLGKPFSAYYGPFEEVVIQGKDWDGQKYKQDRMITLYNLDFCDQISSKIQTREEGVKLRRFEALRQILHDQAECFHRIQTPNWFVFMLTVRDQMGARKLRQYLSDQLYADTSKFCTKSASILPIPSTGTVAGSHTWAMKAFLHNTVRGYLTNPHVAAMFFPVIKYKGGSKMTSPMLHWTIFCQFAAQDRAKPGFYPGKFLADVCTLRANPNGTIVPDTQPGETGKYEAVSPVDWFRRHAGRFNLP